MQIRLVLQENSHQKVRDMSSVFHRTHSTHPLITSRRIEEFTTELNQLRAAVDRAHSPITPAALGFQPSAAESARSRPKSPSLEADDSEEGSDNSPRWLQIDYSQETQERSLELITLQPEVILELLWHFERYYLPHLPILEPVDSISALYESSELLFWTIILVSCQWHPALSYLYQQLIAPHGMHSSLP